MGERNHSPATAHQLSRNRKITLLLGGTVTAVLIAGGLLQVFRAHEGTAGVDSPTAGNQAGVAKVNSREPNLMPVARVGESIIITQDDLARECIALYGRDVLENLISRTIIQRACEQRHVVVTAEEVNQEVMKIAQSFNLPIDSWYQMIQSERGMTAAQYQRDVIWPMLALRKLAGEQTDITEQDLQRAFVRDYGPRVKARMIMTDNLRRAQETWEKAIKNPTDFERLARENSIDATSRALGGAIMPIRRFAGHDELEKAAFKLKEGEVSGIIQIGLNRYAILLCEGYTETVVSDIEQVRDELYENLMQERVQQSVAELFEKLKKETRVDNYLTGITTGGSNSRIQQTSGETGSGGVQQAGGTPQ